MLPFTWCLSISAGCGLTGQGVVPLAIDLVPWPSSSHYMVPHHVLSCKTEESRGNCWVPDSGAGKQMQTCVTAALSQSPQLLPIVNLWGVTEQAFSSLVYTQRGSGAEVVRDLPQSYNETLWQSTLAAALP